MDDLRRVHGRLGKDGARRDGGGCQRQIEGEEARPGRPGHPGGPRIFSFDEEMLEDHGTSHRAER